MGVRGGGLHLGAEFRPDQVTFGGGAAVPCSPHHQSKAFASGASRDTRPATGVAGASQAACTAPPSPIHCCRRSQEGPRQTGAVRVRLSWCCLLPTAAERDSVAGKAVLTGLLLLGALSCWTRGVPAGGWEVSLKWCCSEFWRWFSFCFCSDEAVNNFIVVSL